MSEVTEFKVEDGGFIELLKKKSDECAESVDDLLIHYDKGHWSGTDVSTQISDFVMDAEEAGALVRARVDDIRVEIAFYGDGDDDGDGFILAVRPDSWNEQCPLPLGVQVATTWWEIDSLVDRNAAGWPEAKGPEQLRAVLNYVVREANVLLPYLAKMLRP